jgi:hypothetical protein
MPELKPYLDSWLGTPYVHQGHSRSGVDCIGFVRGFYAELGLDLSAFDVPERTFKPSQRKLLRGLGAAFVLGKAVTGSPLCLYNPLNGAIHVGLCYDVLEDVYSVVEACRGSNAVVKGYYPLRQGTSYCLTPDQANRLILF